ncbi:hypothetical protein D3C87_1954060 [compost metagenome]
MRKQAQISAYHLGSCVAGAVQRMGRYVIGGHFAEKHLSERFPCQFCAGARNGFGHRRMNARKAQLESSRKKGRQVAETDNPFRVLEESIEIKAIHNP